MEQGVAFHDGVGLPEGERGKLAPPVGAAASPSVFSGDGREAELERLRNLPDVQVKLCKPSVNPDAAAYFITNFCRTLDDRGQIRPLAPHGYLLNYIRFLEKARRELFNTLTDKSRQMRLTWAGVAYFLWCMQELEGFTGFMTTRGERLVDDGGEHSSIKSMFGRARFMWQRLPRHLQRPISWTYMKAECEAMTSYCFGEAPTEDSGRSINVSRALVDEAAKLPFDELTIASIKPMCPGGMVLQSTQDGPDTAFARIQEEQPRGWWFFTVDWKDDAKKREGLRDTPPALVERLGAKTSDWFEGATSGMSTDTIASEYLRSKEKSKRGLVYKEFQRAYHVPRDPIVFDARLDRVVVGVDYGSTGFGAAVVGQPVGERLLLVIGDYELEGLGSAPAHAENIWQLLLELGYSGDIEDVELIGGPDTDQTENSGQTVAGYYRDFGFTGIRQCRVMGPGSIDRRIAVTQVNLFRRAVKISPTCETLIKRFPQYRWPVNRVTGHIGGVKPMPGDANHIMDAFGYLCCEVFPEEDSFSGFIGVDERRAMANPYAVGDRDVPHPREQLQAQEDAFGANVFQTIAGGGAHRRVF